MSRLAQADWLLWPQTRTLALLFAPGELRFVGGCVRDAWLGRVVSDVDAATQLPPEMVMVRLREAGIKVIPTGLKHGTVTALLPPHHFEITTLRRDVETDGRRAIVAFTGDWREDAMRRDFTMNALYADAEGEITDYFGGLEDAKAGRVRFIGDANARIHEDALRILRFFRFHAWYGKGGPDALGFAACAANTVLIQQLSGERIAQEMFKLLKAPGAVENLASMQASGVLTEVVPAPVSFAPLARFLALRQTYGVASDPIPALAVLLRSANSDAALLARQVAGRWKLSNAQSIRLAALVTGNMPVFGTEADWKRHIRAEGAERFTDRLLIAAAERGEPPDLRAALTVARSWTIPVFPVTGADLLRAGLSTGKTLGDTLAKLEQAWEADDYHPTKAQLLELLQYKFNTIAT